MDWAPIIRGALIGVVVSLGMTYLMKGSSREIKKNINGEIELRMNKLYQIIGYIGICIAAIFVIAAIYYQEATMYIMGLLMLLLFGGLGMICLMNYRNHFLKFNDQKVIVRDWRNKTKEITWEEINEIKFKSLSGYLIISDSLNKNLKIHQHLIGLKTFADKIEEKTQWKAEDLKIPFIKKK